jgi:hypothetical protein
MARKNKKFAKIDEKDLSTVNGGCKPGGCYVVVQNRPLSGTRAAAPGIRSATPANGRCVVPVGTLTAPAPAPVPVTTAPAPTNVVTGGAPAAIAVGTTRLAI